MQRRLDRAECLRIAKAYIVEHESGSLATALSDAACPRTAVLAALLYASGFYYVAVDESGGTAKYFAGPTADSASFQLALKINTGELSGAASNLVDIVYLVLDAIEHELSAAVYLPPDMKRRRVQAVCRRLGIEESFFSLVLRNQTS